MRQPEAYERFKSLHAAPGGFVMPNAWDGASARAEAGADVLYAPALPDLDAVRAVIRAVAPAPVNVLIGPASGPVPLAELLARGVRRVSLGGALYRRAMAGLADAARELAAGDIAGAVRPALPGSAIAGLLAGRPAAG